jgi:hypothetical protein
MPPRLYSRHSFSEAYIDDAGALVLTEPEPYRFKSFDDNLIHVVQDGDSLFNLAARYYSGIPRPDGLWWVIADFQPDPIHDPTLKIEKGRVLYIPSTRTVLEVILSEQRREE